MIGKSRGCVSYFELGFKSTKSLLPALTGVAVEVDIVGQYCLYCLLSRTNRLLRPSDKCYQAKAREKKKKVKKGSYSCDLWPIDSCHLEREKRRLRRKLISFLSSIACCTNSNYLQCFFSNC